MWKATSIEINGVADKDYSGNLFFAFQNNAIGINEMNNPYDERWEYGRWERNGDILEIIYNNNLYGPPPGSFLERGTNICEIKELTSTKLVLIYIKGDIEYIYYFTKWS